MYVFDTPSFTKYPNVMKCVSSKVHSDFIRGYSDPWVGILQYLGMVGRFRCEDPCFGNFQSDWDLMLCLNTIKLNPSFSSKIGLSLSHLVPEILGPKVGLMFHQNVLFNRF